jgi:Peroxidase
MKDIFASFLIVTFVVLAEAMKLKPQSLSEALDPADNAANLFPTNDNSEPTTVEDIILAADNRIRQTIEQAPYLAATYLRLGFHDCVPNGDTGGCDGCLNLSNPSNFGLLPAVKALQPIVTDLENPILGVSRADIWAYAVLVAAEVSQSNLVFTDSFRVGRKNCETIGTCDAGNQDCSIDGPDQATDFPSSDYTSHQLLKFMHSHFGFDSDQTVAIMGAHTLGFAFPHHSGYEGRYGWVSNTQSLGETSCISMTLYESN